MLYRRAHVSTAPYPTPLLSLKLLTWSLWQTSKSMGFNVSLKFIKNFFSPWQQYTVCKHAVHFALSSAFITYRPIRLLINIHHYITQLKVHINRCNGTQKMKRNTKHRIITSKISPFIWLELMNMIRENLKSFTNFIRSFSFLKSYNWIMSFAFSAAFSWPLW